MFLSINFGFLSKTRSRSGHSRDTIFAEAFAVTTVGIMPRPDNAEAIAPTS